MEQNHQMIKVEEQFKIMADTAPVLIWISGLDKLCYFFNEGWLNFTGRTMEQEFGNGWAEGVHPDDFARCLATYVTSFDQRQKFTMEYRLKRHDGEFRWVTDNGVPRYLEDGTFAGFIGTCVDVNDLLEQQRIRTELLSKKALDKEQDLNQELAVINEEMAASNEELLATNEELTSAREKLSEMNLQLEENVSNRTKLLSISEHRYRSLVDSAPVAIATLTGRDLIITSANEMILQVWGKNNSISGMRLVDALPEIKDQPYLKMLDEVFISSKPSYGNEARVLLEHNGLLMESFFDFIYTPLKGENGETESIIVVATDVTERVNARKKVEYARNRMKCMVATAPIGMTILEGRDLAVEIANKQMLAVWHRNEEQMLGNRLWDVFPEIKNTEFPALLQSVFDTGKAIKLHEVLSPHLEKESYIDIAYDPLFDSNGIVESIMVSVIDITELVNNRKLIEQNQENLKSINEELKASNEELTAANNHLVDTRSALELSMAEVSANENKFSFMLNAIPQQVWTANSLGELAYVNEVVCHDFGFNAAKIVGHGWQEFIHPDDTENCLMKWANALQSGEEYMVEFRLRFADGNYYWHLGRALPLIEEGGVTLWLGTNTNIQIQKQNEEAKDEFLSIASHELKTPLTSIKAFNQLMIRSADKSEKMEMFTKKSADQIHRLEKLIADLLDVTKINAGKVNYNMEKFSFREMIVASIESMQHTSLNHKIILSEGCNIEYYGDRFRLEQVVHNFLSNGIKYSPNGKKILVDCKIENENIIVTIKDFGIGIAKENLSKLFDRYYRVDNSSMRFDGLGLGLFISSEILKRHQGNFWIESKEGEGSTFFFGLPLQQTDPKKTINREDYYEDQHITINYDSELNAICADWTGFQNLKTIKNGGMLILAMLKRYQVNKLLNDNTHVLGTWSEAADWLGLEHMPLMEQAGLRQFAWIYSPSGFSQLSAQKTVDLMLGNVNIEFFTNYDEAVDWLANK